MSSIRSLAGRPSRCHRATRGHFDRCRQGVLGEYQKVWGADSCGQVSQRSFLVMEPMTSAPDRGCIAAHTPHFLVLPRGQSAPVIIFSSRPWSRPSTSVVAAVNDTFPHSGIAHAWMLHDYWRVWETAEQLGCCTDEGPVKLYVARPLASAIAAQSPSIRLPAETMVGVVVLVGFHRTTARQGRKPARQTRCLYVR